MIYFKILFLFFYFILSLGHGMKPMSPVTSSSSSNSGSSTPSFSGSEELNLSDIKDLELTTVKNKPQKATKLLPLDKIQTGIQVFVFNVDQGNCIFIKNYCTYPNTVVILDCGSSNLKREDKKQTKTDTFLLNNAFYLTSIFENAVLSGIIITHPDSDHFNLLDTKFKTFLQSVTCKIDNPVIVMGGLGTSKKQDCIKNLSLFSKDVITIASTKGTIEIKKSSTLTTLKAVNEELNNAFVGIRNPQVFSILESEGIKGNPSKNAQSLFVKLSTQGGTILFTGDAEICTFDAIKNKDDFKGVNFVVMPHHGADTEGSHEVLPMIIEKAENNFVGACVCANPFNSSHGHPRTKAIEVVFPKSAKAKTKRDIGYHEKKDKQVKAKSSHRLLFTPCFLPSQLLWIKLENGLSIFDNEAFITNSNSIDPQNFFVPYTIVHKDQIFTLYQYRHFLNENLKISFEDLKLILKADFETILTTNAASILHINQREKDLLRKATTNQKALIEAILIEIANEQSMDYNEMKKILFSDDFFDVNMRKSDNLCELGTIKNFANINGEEYDLVNVAGDGNCLIAAILLANGEIDREFYYDDEERMSFLTEDQKQKVEQLRQSAASFLTGSLGSQMAAMGTWLGREHMNTLAQAIKKPIVLIQPTKNLKEVSMILYDGKNEKPLKPQTKEDIRDLNWVDPIFIYYADNHFQAIVPGS